MQAVAGQTVKPGPFRVGQIRNIRAGIVLEAGRQPCPAAGFGEKLLRFVANVAAAAASA
jgi:hypothetical protein